VRNYKFKHWLEYADFGLDISQKSREKKTLRDDDQGEAPLTPLDIGYVINCLKKSAVGTKWSTPNDFFGELQWGDGSGALRLEFNPPASRIVVRKLIYDVDSQPTWICKKVVEIQNLYDKHPDSLTALLFGVLEEVDHEGLDSPVNDFEGMQRLVIRIAGKLRSRNTQNVFVYEGIRMVKENKEYIIHWGVTGMGRQARGQRRIDQFAVHCTYDPKFGTVKVSGTEIGGKLDNYSWYYDQPSNFCETFVPSQGEDEIATMVLVLFNTF
jgi:hypothetical protein